MKEHYVSGTSSLRILSRYSRWNRSLSVWMIRCSALQRSSIAVFLYTPYTRSDPWWNLSLICALLLCMCNYLVRASPNKFVQTKTFIFFERYVTFKKIEYMFDFSNNSKNQKIQYIYIYMLLIDFWRIRDFFCDDIDNFLLMIQFRSNVEQSFLQSSTSVTLYESYSDQKLPSKQKQE